MYLNSARGIAAGRLVPAFLTCFLCLANPATRGIAGGGADFLAFAYLVLSAALAVVAWHSWWIDFRLAPLVTAVDVLALLTLPGIVEPHGRVAIAITFAGFIVFATAVRWNWRVAAAVAVAINVIGVAYALFLMGGLTAAFIDNLSGLLNLPVMSVLTVLAATRLTAPAVVRFDPPPFAAGRELLDDALDHMLAETGARAGWLCWEWNDDAGCQMVVRGGLMAEGQADPVRCDGAAASASLPMLFDTRHQRVLSLKPDGGLTASPRGLGRDAFPGAGGPASGMSIPLRGLSGRGRLVLADMPAMSWDHLRRGAAAAEEVVRGLDRLECEVIARNASFASMRHAVARDLHDSVSQSLAGARFWLQSLRRRPGLDDSVRAEVDRVREAIEAEHRIIADLVDQLRSDAQIAARRDLMHDLPMMLRTLALHWRIDARVHGAEAELIVPQSFGFEVQQIVREAVSASVRHRKARSIELLCQKTGDAIRFTVKDDGKGITRYGDMRMPRSIGNRVGALGGQLAIESVAGGTLMEITLPMGGPH